MHWGVLSRYASHVIMYSVSLSHRLVKFISVTKGVKGPDRYVMS